jgi:hypothetical protein
MKIIEDVQWHRDCVPAAGTGWPSLRRLVPEPGEQRTVWVAATAVQQSCAQQLLWVPPYSEINGWDAQPSEIALSQIVTARLRRTDRAPIDQKVECLASIVGRTSLLDACKGSVVDASCDPALLSNLQSAEFWDHVHWGGTATIGGMTFLDVTAGEAGLAILFTQSPQQCGVHYLQFSTDGWRSAALGCWILTGHVQRVIEHHVQEAVPLKDMSAPYLA